MKHSILAAIPALGLLAFAQNAQAEIPKYADVPTGQITSLPTGVAPESIPAGEKVPGIFVTSHKHSKETPAESRYVTVVGDARAAESLASGQGFDPDDAGDRTSACFTESHRKTRRAASKKGPPVPSEEDNDPDSSDPEAKEWQTSQMWQVNLWPKGRNNPQGGVTEVHSERVVTDNGKVSLESVDAWVDAQTRGARLIAKSSLPLTLVGTALGGVKVYAARVDRDSRKVVEFVVLRPQVSASARGSSMVGMRQDGQSMHGSGCGHLRMPLAVDSKGDSGVVMVPVELPDLPKTDEPASATASSAANAKEPAKEPASEKPATATAATPAPIPKGALRKRLGKLTRPSATPSPIEQPDSPPVEREIRTRDMQVHLAMSQTTADPQPVLAVSFGWAGRESVQRVFEPSRALRSSLPMD